MVANAIPEAAYDKRQELQHAAKRAPVGRVVVPAERVKRMPVSFASTAASGERSQQPQHAKREAVANRAPDSTTCDPG